MPTDKSTLNRLLTTDRELLIAMYEAGDRHLEIADELDTGGNTIGTAIRILKAEGVLQDRVKPGGDALCKRKSRFTDYDDWTWQRVFMACIDPTLPKKYRFCIDELCEEFHRTKKQVKRILNLKPKGENQ